MTPLLADMNLSPVTVERLRRRGWDVVRVSDVLPADTPDATILAWARERGRVAVTQDLDFSTLVALGGHRHPSLVTLRLTTGDPGEIADRLLQVLPDVQEALASGYAITLDDHAVRLRALPIQ